ncbi:unnamed protein product [Litomosoides sigmodontis]|uniref:Uncharacterized protein n=1 Tax=Litomosoides sigmodontis TaxID=42156 RepID=A0A3P6SA63_LITSI|nr:unnamed protein product [Litomosoides sigmodontis]
MHAYRENYRKNENWEARSPSNYTKCGKNNASNNHDIKSFLNANLNSDGLPKITVEKKLTHVVANGDIMSNNGRCSSGDITRATQTSNKPSDVVTSFNELNLVPSTENGYANTNEIAYIDEDERAGVLSRSSSMYIGGHKSGHMNGSGFSNVYTQGNSVQEIQPLNDSEDDEVIVNVVSKVSKECEPTTEANIVDYRIQKSAEASAAVGVQEKHDDNPFAYSSGHLRLHGNRVGTYDVQKSLTLGVKRDILAADGFHAFIGNGGERETTSHSRSSVPEVLDDSSLCPSSSVVPPSTPVSGDRRVSCYGLLLSVSSLCMMYVSRHLATFNHIAVSLVSANTSSSVLARELIPAHFDGRETYARGLLDPTEDTRLNPQQTNLDNEMANLKNQPDKCAIAKRRKENKKAKEAKNSYVVESKDVVNEKSGRPFEMAKQNIKERCTSSSHLGICMAESLHPAAAICPHRKFVDCIACLRLLAVHFCKAVFEKEGYMGNLSPEEILKRIEGDSKGKVKGNQKNGANWSKGAGEVDLWSTQSMMASDHKSLDCYEDHSVLANSSKTSGTRKRGDKKDRQTDKATRRSVVIDREAVELSAKMEALNVEKAKTVVVVTETTVESKHGPSSMGETISSETPSPQSDKIEEIGSRTATATKEAVDEGVDDEEQYLSADEGANSNFSDDIYHTDEQSGASGSRDFISDGANYRADDEEVNLLPMAAEESEFIQVTARSKRRGGAAVTQHQQTVMPGSDRKNVYFNSVMDRGARINVRRDADRLRRSSIQLPSDSRRNQPSSRGTISPLPVDCENGSGKSQIIGTGGSVQLQHQRQQQHLKFASATSTSKKIKYGLPSSLQTSRTASPDRRSSQPLTLKYSVAAGNLQSGSSPAPAVASLSENLSDTKRDVLEQQMVTVTAANTKVPARQSWADIAKRRLYDNAETRPNEAPHVLLDSRSSVKEQSVDETSNCDHVESSKKPEHSEQKQTVSVGSVSSDPTVKNFSFFFDPNVQTGIVSKDSERKIPNTVPKTDEDSRFFKHRCSGIVLNLDGGRQVILPDGDVIAAGPPAIADVRQRPEVITASDMWRYFAQDAAVTVTYREYKRQKKRSQQHDWTSNEQKKKEGMGVDDGEWREEEWK